MPTAKITDSLHECQAYLRRLLCQITGPPVIHGFEKERMQLQDVMKRTAELGESNSILLIGPRGAGKTMLLKSVLEELQENANIKENLMVVQLNGLLQTDDRIALKEITRQLQLENTVGERVFGSFAENLQFLLDSLKSGGEHSKPILFVLDEFDLFAQHRNQTLLYNLFDVAQSAQAPICVIGLTTRLDVIELLEKRVKSRFSHRQLHLLPGFSFEDYCQLFKDYLSLPADFPDKKFSREWNKNVEKLSAEAAVQDVLRRQYNIDRDVRALQRLLILPVCKLTPANPELKPGDVVDAGMHQSIDSKAAVLHGISVLELCLVIAMKHLTETYDGEPFNFEMVYNGLLIAKGSLVLFLPKVFFRDDADIVQYHVSLCGPEYQKFARRSSMQTFEKPVVLKAFEHICTLELVRPTDGSTRALKEYRPMTLLIERSQVMEALQRYPACPTEVRQWASSAIVPS